MFHSITHLQVTNRQVIHENSSLNDEANFQCKISGLHSSKKKPCDSAYENKDKYIS